MLKYPASPRDTAYVGARTGGPLRRALVARLSRNRALQVSVVTDAQDLAALESEWHALESQIVPRTPFRTATWNQLWWRHFCEASTQARDEMRVYLFRDTAGVLIGIVPMVLTRRPGVLPLVQQLQYFGADPNVTEIRGPICRARDQRRVAEALRERLLDEASTWDWVQWFGPSSSKLGRPLFPEAQFAPEDPLEEFYLPLPDSWDALRGSLSRNVKESIRKCYNSLKRDHLAFTFDVVRQPADVEAALETFFSLHAERASLRETVPHPNVFDSEVARRFLSEYAMQMASRDQLRIFQGSIGGQVVATRIGFKLGDDLYLYYSGYAPAWRRYSVMTTLVVEALQWAIQAGFRRVHLSTGRDVSKLRWGPSVIRRSRGTVLAGHWASAMRFRLFHFAREHANGATWMGKLLAPWRRKACAQGRRA